MNLGFIYFIQESETERIKIGFSEKHPQGRLESFQTGNSNKLVLLGYIEGTQEDETRLHREFEEERIRKRNEWFEPSPQLKKKIKDLLKENIKEKEEGIPDFQDDTENEIKHYESVVLFYNNMTSKWSTEETTNNKTGEYTGSLKNGQAHGNGKLVYSEDSKDSNYNQKFTFSGEFKDGQYLDGIEQQSSGDFYMGEWKNGYPHGNGTQNNISICNEIRNGEWRDGKFWKGKVQNSDGKVISVFWQGVEKDPMVMGYNNEDDEKTSERNILIDLFWILLVTTPVLIFLFW